MNFKKILAVTMSAMMLLTGFTGCASQTEDVADKSVSENLEDYAASSGQQTPETRTIIDHTGAEVTIPTELDRIVISSILPLPSVFCLFKGSAEDIVGIHPSSMAAAENSYLINVFPELKNADTSFVENGEVNIEQLLALKPDVVLYSASNTDERKKYDNAGIPAIGFSTTIADYDCVETYAAWISLFGEIYGESDAANKIVEKGRKIAENVTAITDEIAQENRPDVLVLFNYANGIIKTSGSGFFGEYWINSAGGRNVAEELTGTPEINMEQIYQWDPDIILITNFSAYLPEDLYNNSIEGHDWSNVSAVKNNKVYKFPLGMYRWFPPASDTPLVLMWLAKTIQPELFADLDMDAEIKAFYEEYYGVVLTDEDIQEIYSPAREAAGL